MSQDNTQQQAQNQQEAGQKVLYGDDAIVYQKQVIAQNNQALEQVSQINIQLNNRLISIMNQLPGACACAAPRIISEIMTQHDQFIDQNTEIAQQLEAKQRQLAQLQAIVGPAFGSAAVDAGTVD